MNKDVIYIEPEDDITDIVGRIKRSEQKIVALVPPKKPGVLRSAINIKLIAKAANQADKAVVIVTADPSIIKMAAVSGLPVAKTLQSRPVIPTAAMVESKEKDIETIDDDSEDETPAKKPAKTSSKDADMNLNSAELEEENEKKSGGKEKKISKIPNLDKYRKYIIAGGIALVLILGLVISAIISAFGSAEIAVKIRTNSSQFSENVTLVTKSEDVNNAEGKLLLEKVEFSKENSVEFAPTGEKNFGNKASGTLTVVATLQNKDETYSIPAGTEFYTGNFAFVSTAAASIAWDGSFSSCIGQGSGCTLQASVPVMAKNGGASYNIEPAGQGAWKASISGISAYNSAKFSGGTDDIAKVVTKEDVTKAQEDFGTSDDAKEELLGKIGDDMVAVEASYKAEASDPTSSPAVGEKVSGDKAKLTAKTTYTIFVVSRSAIEEYIKASTKGSLGEDQIIYDIGKPFFERYVDDKGSYSAKLKTTIKSGPEVTEKDVLEKAKGEKIDKVKSLLQSIKGIEGDGVQIKTSVPWASSIPKDENKITVKIEVSKE